MKYLKFNLLSHFVIILILSFGISSCEDSLNSGSDNSSNQDNADGNSTSEETITATVKLLSDDTNLSIGQNITVDVIIEKFPQTEGGGVSLHYNPAYITAKSVSTDVDTWEFKSSTGKIDNVNGSVSDILVSSYQGVSGESLVAQVEFELIAAGESLITLEESQKNPFGSNGERINPKFKSIMVNTQ